MYQMPQLKKGVSSKTKEVLGLLFRNSENGLITAKKAREVLNMTAQTASAKMASLAKRGWLARVKRGTYFIIPLESGAGLKPVIDDPWVLAQVLYSPCYIGGWSAAEHWGLTEQIFRQVFVVTSANIRRRSETILGTEFHIVRVKPERLKNLKPVWREQRQVMVSDREGTIADALNSPDWVGGFRHLAAMVKTYTEEPNPDYQHLLEKLEEIKKGAGYKRLGYLLENLSPDKKQFIEKICAKRSKGNIKLDPAVPSKGSLNKKWGLWINASLI